MVELVDTLDSKSGDSNIVWVQVPLRPPCFLIWTIIEHAIFPEFFHIGHINPKQDQVR